MSIVATFFRAFAAAMALVASTFAAALPPNVEHVETYRGVSQYRLKSNGMTILLNEASGNTGSARAVTTAQANAAFRRHFFGDRLNVIVAGDLDALPD